MRSVRYVVITLLLLAGIGYAGTKAAPAPKDKSAECLACHSDPSLAKDVNGKAVSLHVDEGKFKNSIHGSMFGCTDCHSDVKGFPHDPAPATVKCETCHADQVTAYKSSVHGQALAAGNKQAATCLSCHGSPHEIVVAGDPNSTVAHANVAKTCGSCHGQKFVMESSGRSAAPFFSYQESVRRLHALDVDLVLPGHAEPFTGHRAVVDRLLAFYEKRQARLLGLVGDGSPTAYDLAVGLFPRARAGEVFLTVSETIANLEVLEERGRLLREESGGVARFRAVPEA